MTTPIEAWRSLSAAERATMARELSTRADLFRAMVAMPWFYKVKKRDVQMYRQRVAAIEAVIALLEEAGK